MKIRSRNENQELEELIHLINVKKQEQWNESNSRLLITQSLKKRQLRTIHIDKRLETFLPTNSYWDLVDLRKRSIWNQSFSKIKQGRVIMKCLHSLGQSILELLRQFEVAHFIPCVGSVKLRSFQKNITKSLLELEPLVLESIKSQFTQMQAQNSLFQSMTDLLYLLLLPKIVLMLIWLLCFTWEKEPNSHKMFDLSINFKREFCPKRLQVQTNTA